jgi:glycosyltransferase involved in cell wall biosynthesis
LRTLKGVDVLIEALALLARSGPPITATIVGSGPDAVAFASLAQSRGLVSQVKFPGAMPARQAFMLGRVLVVPSRAESLPYIVLEGAAAGMPMLATNVGGIPEIFGTHSAHLLPPGDAPALAQAIHAALSDPAAGRIVAGALRERVQAEFSADVMTDAVIAAYQSAINQNQGVETPAQ